MTRLDQLTSFVAVVDLKSFSLAAERLGITQPTISLQIKALENELGVCLLHRDGYAIIPTVEGSLLYNNSLKILSIYEKTKQEIKKSQGNFHGSLIIGASSGPAEYPIPILLGQFKQAHPESNINLQVGDSSEVIDKVANQAIELGFVGTKRRDGNLVFKPYLEDKLVLVTAKNHALANRKSLAVQDLHEVPLIMQQPGSGTTINLQSALAQTGIKLNELNILMDLGLQDSVKSAVLAGYGATIISYLGVKSEVQKGELVIIEIEDLDLFRQLYICYNRLVPLSNLAKEFLSFAIENKAK